jgi:hypothetical protein
MIDTTKPALVIQFSAGGRYLRACLAGLQEATTVYRELPEAAEAVSRLAKAGVKNLRVRRFHNGVVTNLKE